MIIEHARYERYQKPKIAFPNLFEVEKVTNKLYSFYKRSDKRIADFREFLERQGKKEINLHYIHDIR